MGSTTTLSHCPDLYFKLTLSHLFRTFLALSNHFLSNMNANQYFALFTGTINSYFYNLIFNFFSLPPTLKNMILSIFILLSPFFLTFLSHFSFLPFFLTFLSRFSFLPFFSLPPTAVTPSPSYVSQPY